MVLGIFDLPESPGFLVGWIIFLPLSILAGGYIVRRAVATRWTETIGGPPPVSMLLGVVADRLVIWRWPRRGNPPPGRMVDELLTDVSLRPRVALLGGLDIELSNGRTLFVNHSMGPNERHTIALILDAVADAHGRSDDATQPNAEYPSMRRCDPSVTLRNGNRGDWRAWAVLEVRPDQRIRVNAQVTGPPVLTFFPS